MVIILPLIVKGQSLIVVDNGSPQFFIDLNVAIDSASSGSAIYVPGGVYTLTTKINKKLFIYGSGHDPDSSTATGISKISGNISIIAGADSGMLMGFVIPNALTFGSSEFANDKVVTHYTIARCNIGYLQLTPSNGLYCLQPNSNAVNNLFYNNVIGGLFAADAQNNLFLNNIFSGIVQRIGINSLLQNNIFLAQGYCSAYCYAALGSVLSSSIANNIFTSNALSIGTTHFCYGDYVTNNTTFSNNLFVENNAVNNYCSTCNDQNNFWNQDSSSIFINNTSGHLFSYSSDYHIQATSAGHNGGTDGSDVGIYGGIYPWKEGSLPSNPHISYKSIASGTDMNGNLQINIKVEGQDH